MRGGIPSEYRCCFCLHVRTGTVLFGTWQMLLQFGGMLFLLYYILFFKQPQLIDNIADLSTSGDDLKQLELGAVDTNVGRNQFPDGAVGIVFDIRVKDSFNKERYFENQCFALLLTTLSFVVTAMMVQGAWQGRPSYLLPFFCLQIFDFVVSCLTVAGFFSYDDVRRWVTEQVNSRYLARTLEQVNIHYMLAIVVIMAALILTLKAYFICLVWACYKYLCEQERSRSGVTLTSYDLSPSLPVASAESPDIEILLPPKYEDVIKQQQQNASAIPQPPPAYN